MSERDDLVREMQTLSEKSAKLMAEHAKIVHDFQRIQQRIEALDREQKSKAN